MQPVKVWDILGSKWKVSSWISCFRSRKNGQTVMARWLGQSLSKTATLVECSHYSVVSTYQKSSNEGQFVNRCQVLGGQGSLMQVGKAWSAQSHRISEKLNAGHDRKVTEHTADHSLLSECPWWPLPTAESTLNGHSTIRTGAWSNGRRLPGLINHVF